MSLHLDGGYESGGDVRAEQRGHVELPHVFLFSQGAGDALLAQELEAGHPVLHAHHVQRRSTREEQARVSMAPTDGGDGPLERKEPFTTKEFQLSASGSKFSVSGRPHVSRFVSVL